MVRTKQVNNENRAVLNRDFPRQGRSLIMVPEEMRRFYPNAKPEQMKKVMRSAYSKEYIDYVCVDALGKLYDPDFVTGHFGQLLKKHNLKKIRFHDFRHSCASVLLAQGVPMKQIQEWLGHSDMSTTANIYSHLDAVSKADTSAAMSKVLG